MPRTPDRDFLIRHRPDLVGLIPLSEAAEHWLERNVMADSALWVERHHAPDLLAVLCREGFDV